MPIEGCIEEIDVDLVVESVGYMPNPPLKLEGVVDMTKSGEIMVDNASMK